MSKYLISIILFSFTTEAISQMNFQDSTVHVVAYWNLGESYEYEYSLQKLVLEDTDTLSNETISCDIQVTVIDSTVNSYVVRWLYKNFETDSQNIIEKKITSVADGLTLDIKLDEYGVIQGVQNWEEVRDYMHKSFDKLEDDVGSNPLIVMDFDQMKRSWETKSSIERVALRDAQQYYNFHGAELSLKDTLDGVVKTENTNFVSTPFDTYVGMVLVEMDSEYDEFVVKYYCEVDSKQLTETTFNYLDRVAASKNEKFLPREQFEELKNSTESMSLIHNSGWLIKSMSWVEESMKGRTKFQITTINMK